MSVKRQKFFFGHVQFTFKIVGESLRPFFGHQNQLFRFALGNICRWFCSQAFYLIQECAMKQKRRETLLFFLSFSPSLQWYPHHENHFGYCIANGVDFSVPLNYFPATNGSESSMRERERARVCLQFVHSSFIPSMMKSFHLILSMKLIRSRKLRNEYVINEMRPQNLLSGGLVIPFRGSVSRSPFHSLNCRHTASGRTIDFIPINAEMLFH